MINPALLEMKTCEIWPPTIRWWLGRHFRGMIVHAAVELDWLAQAKQGKPYARATRSEVEQLYRTLSRPNSEKDPKITADFWIANQIADAYREAYGPLLQTNAAYTAARSRVTEDLRRASQGGENMSRVEVKRLMNFCISLHTQMERWTYTVFQPTYRCVG